MRIHLAGLEKTGFINSVGLTGHKYGLFSYFHMSRNPDAEQRRCLGLMCEFDLDMICDSGLFTMMFGSGKGKKHDLAGMVDYTRRYIARVKQYGLPKVTMVECDVHKILGMPSVFELRKHFRDSGIPTIYVWHREEGIDGLLKLVEEEQYVAISVPELRIIFKSHAKYESGVIELLTKIEKRCAEKSLPMKKVHLLGNTIEYTMKNRQAYSCDSTSWLAGVRYGQGIVYRHQNLTKAHIRSPLFQHLRESAREEYPSAFARVMSMSTTEKMRQYLWNTFVSASSYSKYQQFLDSHYQWIGGPRGSNAR